MYRMTDEEFEVAVAEALDAMPEQFMEALRNVAPTIWDTTRNGARRCGMRKAKMNSTTF